MRIRASTRPNRRSERRPLHRRRRRQGNTRERILRTALDLFNIWGTGAVSTNRIARSLGMSPGNLYYHFRNKEEIIRELFERLSARWNSLYAPPVDRMATLIDLDGILRGHLEALWGYRFISREIAALIQRDPDLREMYALDRVRGQRHFVHLINAFIRGGLLRKPQGATAVTELAAACRVVTEFWLPFVELGRGPVSARALDSGVTAVRRILESYVSGARR